MPKGMENEGKTLFKYGGVSMKKLKERRHGLIHLLSAFLFRLLIKSCEAPPPPIPTMK
jgi:hypothetical protein